MTFTPYASSRACLPMAGAISLSVALIALPLAMALPVQIDQSLQLLILPAWWLIGRSAQTRTTYCRRDRWLLPAFAATTILSIACSDHPARAAVASAALWWALAAAVTARGLTAHRTAGIIVLAGMAGGAAVGVIADRIGLAAGATQIPLYTHARIFGLHMFAGSIAAIGWIMLQSRSDNRYARIAAWLVAWIVWTGLAWSGSRAPVLGLACALTAWFCVAGGAERRRLTICAGLLGAAGMTTSWLLGPNLGDGWWSALARTSTAGADLSALSSTRSDFWQVVWQAIGHAPWVGHGGDHYLFMRPRQVGNQPHNFILQWLLEYGFVGAIPLFGLLANRLWEGLRGSLRARKETAVVRVAWAGLVGATVCALFDGVFYHVIVALPVAVLAGLSFVPEPKNTATSAAQPPSRRLLAGWLAAGIGALLLHNALSLALTKTTPSSPATMTARALRLFPSETFGLWNWLNAWQGEAPEASLEWAEWAQRHSTSPAWFHLYAAQCHWRQGRPDLALAEVDAGLEVAASKLETSELQRLRQALAPADPRP